MSNENPREKALFLTPGPYMIKKQMKGGTHHYTKSFHVSSGQAKE